MTNPYTEMMLANDYHAGDVAEAIKIKRENDNHDVLECQCGGEAFYKHTIGTHKCVACDSLWSTKNGVWF